MLERVEKLITEYCIWVFSMVGVWIEKTHVVVGVGLPALGFIAMVHFLPVWVHYVFFVLVVAPCMAAFSGIVVYALCHSRRR